MFHMEGEPTLILRDAYSGEEILRHTQKNLVTDQARLQHVWNASFGTNGLIRAWGVNLYIHPIAVVPSNRINFLAAAFSDAYRAPDVTTRDVAGKVITFTVTYPVPSVDRTIRSVGVVQWAANSIYRLFGNGLSHISTIVNLSTPVTQTTQQTLELQYKVSFNRS